jgi:hypothetical protein
MNDIFTYIFEVCELTHLHDVEIKISLLRNDLDHEVGVNLELADDHIVDEQLAGIMHGKEKGGVG